MLTDPGQYGEQQLHIRPPMWPELPPLCTKAGKQNAAEWLTVSQPHLTLIQAKTPRRPAQASSDPSRDQNCLSATRVLSRAGRTASQPTARWWRGRPRKGGIFATFVGGGWLPSHGSPLRVGVGTLSCRGALKRLRLSLRCCASPAGPGGSIPTPFRTVSRRSPDQAG